MEDKNNKLENHAAKMRQIKAKSKLKNKENIPPEALENKKPEDAEKVKKANSMSGKLIEITKYRNDRNLMFYPFCSTAKAKRLNTIK